MTEREFNICVDNFGDGIYRFIYKNLRDEDEAKNIVQNCFEKLWIRHRNIEFDKAKSWLFTTAYRNMIDFIRESKSMTPIDVAVEEKFSYSPEYSGVLKNLEAGLARLPEAQRSVVMLRDYEGYNYREIGEITGLNESQVKVYLFRARTFLKNYVGKMEALI